MQCSRSLLISAWPALRRPLISGNPRLASPSSGLSPLPQQRTITPLFTSVTRQQTRLLRGGRSKRGNAVEGQRRQLPIDRELLEFADMVHLREDEEGLSNPIPTQTVLKQLDLKKSMLLTVALPKPDKPGGLVYPVCMVVDREAYMKQQDEKRRETRKREVMSKELEVNWAIDANDLGHKMKQMRQFLSKGCTVHVTLLQRPLKRHRKATTDEAKETLRRVEEAIAEFPGAFESKKRVGELLRTLQIVIEPPAPGKRKLAAAGKAEGTGSSS